MNNDSMMQGTPAEKSKAGMWMGIAIVVLLLLAGAYFVFGRTGTEQSEMSEDMTEQETGTDHMMDDEMMIEDTSEAGTDTTLPSAVDVTTDTAVSTSTTTDENVKTFEVSGTNFAFSQEEIRVNQGDTVRIVFTSEEGFHDWVVDEFNAATEQVQTGGTTTVEFVADKAGTFEYYCGVGNHRQMGMVGNLIVE